MTNEDTYTFPASFAQERLWFLEQLEPNSPLYNIPLALKASGALNIEALGKALEALVARHESLRTTFVSRDGTPMQVVSRSSATKLSVHDLSIWSGAKRTSESRRLAALEARAPFDLERGPLLRVKLLRLDSEEHVLLLTMHHIISDHWSLGILFRELATLYGDFTSGQPSSLPPLPIQYADFAVWQRHWLAGDTLEAQLSYWKRQLAGVPARTELPIDRPWPAVQTHRGERRSLLLSRDLTTALLQLSRSRQATLFMTLLAAFQVLLSRYGGEENIAVGTPIANRNRTEIENVIGFFVNTLVLRTDLSGDPKFCDLLTQVRKVALDAYVHQDVPFEKLVEALQPERSLSHSPLFQVMFALQNAPSQALQMAGLHLSPFELDVGTSKFALSVSAAEEPEGLKLAATYNADLFNASTIGRLLDHFKRLLEAVAANPEERIGALPVMAPSERRQVVLEWPGTAEVDRDVRVVHAAFEEQVTRSPSATALIIEDRRVTYAELNARANQLARFLERRGAGPEALVGVCMERSPETVMSLLAILKAGAAYLPLDPNHPSEWLSLVIRDAGASIVLSQRELAPNLPEECDIICLDSEWSAIAQENEANPPGGVTTPENLAYVIYTSGSTGKPKGVQIPHRALANFAEAAAQEYGLKPRDRVLQFASISFDTAVEEIFPCLIRGATLVFRTDSMLDSPSLFMRKCREWGVTVLDLPTAYWHDLTENLFAAQRSIPESLRLVIIGGEKASPIRAAQWQTYSRGRRLLNTYGPTESTVVATLWDATTAFGNGTGGEVPIGRPIRDVQVYILDRRLNPVPPGAFGELHIGGSGLARGYLNRADLTAEKFIPNPFNAKPGERLYKTGDWVRWLPDGNIDFVGRIDNQVKIRGFRIEPGQIEAILLQHPAVRDAVVLARDEQATARRLVAYVVPRGPGMPSIGELREFVKARLPEYMVPAAFLTLNALPVTSNGKVDRAKLPDPGHSRPDLDAGFAEPRRPVEKVLAQLWAEVLKLEKVGIHDNFFELGGHSLLATQVISRARQAFHLELPLRILFENPTVAGLALQITRAQSTGTHAEEVVDIVSDLESLSDEEAMRLLTREDQS